MRLAARALTAALVPLAATAVATAIAPQSATAATATYRLSTGTLSNGSSRVQRWNPCQTRITYKVNVAAVPAGSRTAVLNETRAAVARLATATRMTFSYKGTTTEVPGTGALPDTLSRMSMKLPRISTEYSSECASATATSVAMRMSSAMRPSGLSCSPGI